MAIEGGVGWQDPSLLDRVWLLVCAGLVFLMQPGFMCLESGLTRAKNSINVAAKNLADLGLSVALYWLLGFGLMFGASWQGWLGRDRFLFGGDLEPHLLPFFLFQALFCGTATTIVSGAVAERVRFVAYLVISSLISGVIYPLFGHWSWGGLDRGEPAGWLGQLGFIDFAGSTVVHSIGGWVALAVLVIIGPRADRFDAGGRLQQLPRSSLPLSVLGGMLLWLGWLGFNGGSLLQLSPQVAELWLNTLLAGAGGMLNVIVISGINYRLVDVELMINGLVAGLVAITAPCALVEPAIAFVIGAMGSGVMMWVGLLLHRARIDDAVGAVPVHLGAGIWGTLAAALFPDPELLPLPRGEQVLIQVLGIGVAGLWAFGITWGVIRGLGPRLPLRISAAEEELGLNQVDHGVEP